MYHVKHMWKDSAQNQSDEFEADGPVFDKKPGNKFHHLYTCHM